MVGLVRRPLLLVLTMGALLVCAWEVLERRPGMAQSCALNLFRPTGGVRTADSLDVLR